MDFDTILDKVSSWNTYQKKILFMYFLPMCFVVAFRINYIFIFDVPEHYCDIPMNQGFNMTQEQWRELVLIKNSETGHYESCIQYDFNFASIHTENELLAMNMSQLNVTACKGTWAYDRESFIETVPSLNNWVCDQSFYPTIIITVGCVATLIGSLLYAYLSDTWLGRKRASYIQIIPTLIGGIAILLNPPFWAYCVCHFISMLIFPSIFQVTFILVAEQSSANKRVIINGLSFLFWTLGLCAAAFVAWILHGHWFYLLLVELIAYIPLLATYRFVYESPRYLVSQEKYGEAERVLVSIAKVNKQPIPNNLKEMLMKLEQHSESKASVLQLFSSPKLAFKTITMTCIWLTCGMTYLGLQMNVSNLGGNVFLNYFFLSAVELISFLLGMYLMDVIGRRVSQSSFLLFTSLTLFVTAAIPPSYPYIVTSVLCIIAKMSITVNFIVTYQQGLEIYPTVLRTMGIGLGSAFSQGFSMLTPTIIQVGKFWPPLTYIVFGLILSVSFTLSVFLPETYNKSLPETVEDARNFGKGQRFFSLNLTKNCNDNAESLEKKKGFPA